MKRKIEYVELTCDRCGATGPMHGPGPFSSGLSLSGNDWEVEGSQRFTSPNIDICKTCRQSFYQWKLKEGQP